MKLKKTATIVLKALVSISLLFLIIKKVNWDQVQNDFFRADYVLLSVVFILNILERVFLTYKWQILIKIRGIVVSFGRLFLINAIGVFWGLFLPSSIGTDIVRGYYLVKNNSEKTVSVSSVFLDRVLGLFSMFLIGIIAISFSGTNIVSSTNKIQLYAAFIIILLVLYLFLKESFYEWFSSLISKLKIKKVTDLIIKLHKSILEYKRYPKTVAISFLINLLVQATRIFTYYIISLTFGISIPIFYFVLFIPVIMLVLTIPISIGGLGVREGAFIAFFALVGLPMDQAVVISFTNTIVNTFNTLLGGLAYMFYTEADKSRAALSNSK